MTEQKKLEQSIQEHQAAIDKASKRLSEIRNLTSFRQILKGGGILKIERDDFIYCSGLEFSIEGSNVTATADKKDAMKIHEQIGLMIEQM